MNEMNENEQKLPTPNRKYRDTIFRMIFREKKELLSLFNAVHGTNYDNPDDLEITTLENAVYMTFKNDISCIVHMLMDLYEHQSTVNPNIPLRDLFYVARLYESIINNRDLYARKRLLIPTPTFVVFYNGEEEQPERKIYRLSDSYAVKTGDVNLELLVIQLNINPGYNAALVKNCKTLFEYMEFTDRIRRYSKEMPLNEAVPKAVDECISEGILAEFLRKNKSEVIPMSIFEYDEELHLRTVREEGYEDGVADGYEHGKIDGYENGVSQTTSEIIRNMFKNNLSPEVISQYTAQPLEYIYQIGEELNAAHSQAELREDIKYGEK
jgi:hypothetical protein